MSLAFLESQIRINKGNLEQLKGQLEFQTMKREEKDINLEDNLKKAEATVDRMEKGLIKAKEKSSDAKVAMKTGSTPKSKSEEALENRVEKAENKLSRIEAELKDRMEQEDAENAEEGTGQAG